MRHKYTLYDVQIKNQYIKDKGKIIPLITVQIKQEK